jgi:hypothetical protein
MSDYNLLMVTVLIIVYVFYQQVSNNKDRRKLLEWYKSIHDVWIEERNRLNTQLVAITKEDRRSMFELEGRRLSTELEIARLTSGKMPDFNGHSDGTADLFQEAERERIRAIEVQNKKREEERKNVIPD